MKTRTLTDMAGTAKKLRNKRLSACDWTQLQDVNMTESNRQQWGDYRQALRDVPSQSGFPDTIVWPIEPK